MELKDLSNFRNDIKNETKNYKNLIKLLQEGHRNKSCPPSLSIVLIVFIVLIIIISLILIYL